MGMVRQLWWAVLGCPGRLIHYDSSERGREGNIHKPKLASWAHGGAKGPKGSWARASGVATRANGRPAVHKSTSSCMSRSHAGRVIPQNGPCGGWKATI